MMPISFVAVEDLLEDTIARSTKTQSDAGGELMWLRARLVNERRDHRSSSKLALQLGGAKSSGNQSRAIPTQPASSDSANAPANKENAAALAKPTGPSASKVRPAVSIVSLS